MSKQRALEKLRDTQYFQQNFLGRTNDQARRRRNQNDNTKRQRTRRTVLGPLLGIGEKWPCTARRRGPAIHKSHSRTFDPHPNQRLRDYCLLARLFEEGV